MANSQRRLSANRENAKRSTGPRSTAGKRRSAGNAFRHGLAVPIETLSEFGEDIERLATMACPDCTPEALPLAREFAAATLDLRRIRQARFAIERRMLEDLNRWIDEIVPQVGLRSSWPPPLLPVEMPMRLSQMSATGVRAPALNLLAKRLGSMFRYERRALSRRNAAVRALDAALHTRATRP